MRFPLLSALSLATVLVLAAQPNHLAYAQVDSREGIALQNQMYQLRQEMQSMRDQLARGGGGSSSLGRPGYPPPSSAGNDMVAQLLTRVDALEDQVRQLRGRIDELQNQSQRQSADLGKRIDDLSFQINPQGGQPAGGPPPSQLTPPQPGYGQLPPLQPGLVQSGGPGPAPLLPPQAGLAPKPPLPPQTVTPRVRTPELAMQEGNAALARRDYPAAEQAAREVLANKTSPRAYDGQLLMAQALYGERQYSNAAIAFDDAYTKSPKGAHAQDALLGVANALTAINEKKAACATLSKLHSEFPQPRGDLHDGIVSAAQRAGCK